MVISEIKVWTDEEIAKEVKKEQPEKEVRKQ